MPGRRMSAAERDAQQAQVVELRRARVSFAQIGKQLKPAVSAQRAHQIYEAALLRNPLTATQVDEYRVEALELADLAVRQLMTLAVAAATTVEERIKAWVAIRGWEEHKAKTTGSYAPVRTEVITIDVIDRHIAALEAELGTRAALTEGVGDAVDAEIARLEADLAGGAAAGAAAPAAGTASSEAGP